MASILTNTAAMAALQTLRSIDRAMSTTQDRISSGLKVGSAADNAAYWSIATTMRSESSSLTVVGEALGMGASLAEISNTAVQSIVELMSQVRDRVVAAGEQTTDRAKLQTELDELYAQMGQTTAAATFNGMNWLTATGETTILSGLSKDSSGATILDFITVPLEASGDNIAAIVETVAGDGTPGSGLSVATDAEVATALEAVDAAIKGLTELGARFGAASTRIDTQQDFIHALTDAIDRGIGALVDADLNEESSKIKALQTQQQLAVQSLQIANTGPEMILQLFRS
ncbi:flagellin [Pseudorhizobium flavum]|uniref:Flagellin n=1 Tax=Pseudorhizobium flavum TaxID=1335061 RepID=A0A7W9Z158_9HYPH|nr:flagellin [Pseudorhizobium flavum]MBB6182142.1 flagellin [Pseudorhizobium flavum]CAD6631972.1 flagellin A [Pseudorhizobium flavum]